MQMPLLNDPTTLLRQEAAALTDWMVALRRDIHAHPELAFEETRTAGIVSAELTRLGIPHRTGIGGTGILGTIEGGLPGPTLALRADMDALPIHEETGLDFASTVPGKMHACGHDLHTTTLLGTAAVLQKLAPQLAGRIVLIFQPAEETLEGAHAMIRDGAAEGLDLAVTFHNRPEIPVGDVVLTRGPALAASDLFDLELRGKSGHAAHPYAAIDPIVAAAHFVTQAQTVVGREVHPLHPAVVTVGQSSGGTTYNIIPERVQLKGTVRTLHAEARDIAEAALRRLVEGIETGMRVKATLTYRRMISALVNNDSVLDPAMEALRAQFGEAHVREGQPSMGAEDFAAFTERVPGLQFGIGAATPGRQDRLHNAFYQPDEGCLPVGVEAMSRVALELLGPRG